MDTRAEIEWLTPGEVADHLRVSRRTVSRWIANGKLTATRIGSDGRPGCTVRIHRSVIDQLTPTLSAAA
ncbi:MULTISPECIES: helix-turn-helix domain-containing protein [unclassified Streptomyces]|uniref:helix-turn-helix domain-containing protein n=1 Tax=unclassified Streptomyces TaxID=2593676 RepID=UPI000D662C1E|nr:MULTISPECIES: helix-turn-helix domain-containing protein [unclassified Streptomyces]AWL36650.1 MerR family transcriptional regulator [Streptomyces sp. SM17]MBT2877648.1 helix-turn-helix domain-containing protein [Streptomyces sp. McG6]MBT2884984.1 helix-turn-helix domain-containing protein [Streptomyces sp. McG5]MBT2890477.1 helix-turn-helix domain-containing protein [Streptomyces sp. McG2]